MYLNFDDPYTNRDNTSGMSNQGHEGSPYALDGGNA